MSDQYVWISGEEYKELQEAQEELKELKEAKAVPPKDNDKPEKN